MVVEAVKRIVTNQVMARLPNLLRHHAADKLKLSYSR